MDADVIIVGAGPAGTMVAKELASIGISALILEKVAFPREKICSEIVTYQCLKDFPWLESYIRSYSYGVKVFTAGGDLFFDHESDKILFAKLVRRSNFDESLLHSALTAGAKIKFGEIIQTIKINPDNVIIRTDQNLYECKILIGADSAFSTVARKTDLGIKLNPENFGIEIGEHFEISEVEIDKLYGISKAVSLFPRYGKLYGFGKIIPSKGSIYIGLSGSLTQKSWLENAYAQFIELLREKSLIPMAITSKSPQMGVFPIVTADKRTFGIRTFLIGDAAGFVSPFFGIGIHYALLSAQLVVKSVVKLLNEPIFSLGLTPSYYKLWQKEFGEIFSFHEKIRQFFLESSEHSFKFLKWAKTDDRILHNFLEFLRCSPKFVLKPSKLVWRFYKYSKKYSS